MSAEKFIKKIDVFGPFFFLIVAVLYFVFSFVTTEPIIQDENYNLIPFYATPSSLGLKGEVAKIFDVCVTDGCIDRFRPVGHLLEWADAKMITILNHIGPAHFRSFFYLISGILGFLVLGWAVIPLFSEIPLAYSWMMGATFMISPQVLVQSAYYFRPGKLFGAWVCAWMVGIWIRSYFGQKMERSTIFFSSIGFILAPLIDEQVALFPAGLGLISLLDL